MNENDPGSAGAFRTCVVDNCQGKNNLGIPCRFFFPLAASRAIAAAHYGPIVPELAMASKIVVDNPIRARKTTVVP